jgi:serine/threonine protein kinase
MDTLLHKYQKYKQKYLNAKQILDGGNIMFTRDKNIYNIVKKTTSGNDIIFEQKKTPPTSFSVFDRDIIDIFMNIVLNNILIDGKKFSTSVADNASYVSSGVYGSTFIIDNFILKIVHMIDPQFNSKEIRNMITVSNFPQYVCPLYCVITHNKSLMNYISNTTAYDGIFQIFCHHNSSVDTASLDTQLVRVDSDSHSHQSSNLCFIIMEKGNYDVLAFQRKTYIMNMKNLLNFVDIHELTIGRNTVRFQDTMNTAELFCVYMSKMMSDLLNAIHVLNTQGNLLHCDIKNDNIMIMPNAKNTLPQFKLIDFGISQILPQNEDLYTVVDLSISPHLMGLQLFKRLASKQTLYTTLFDYYRLFDAISMFLNIIYLSQDRSLAHAPKIRNMIDSKNDIYLAQAKKDELVSLLLMFYDKYLLKITNLTIHSEASKLFNLLIILSQIPYLLGGDYDIIFFDKPHRIHLDIKYKSYHSIDMLTPVSSFRQFVNNVLNNIW